MFKRICLATACTIPPVGGIIYYNTQYNTQDYSLEYKVPEGTTFYRHDSNRCIILPDGIEIVSFGDKFNRHIKLPHSLRNIWFGRDFNQPIDLPDNLERISFGRDFNQPINLPDNLKYLYFGNNFNQDIILPNKIKEVRFGKYFNKPLNFPESLVNLILSNSYEYTVPTKFYRDKCEKYTLYDTRPPGILRLCSI